MSLGLGSPEEIEMLARTYDRVAAEVHAASHGGEAQLAGLDWTGPRSDRFRAKAASLRSRGAHDAQVFADTANRLRRHATWVREREALMRSWENRIVQWATAHPPDPLNPNLPSAADILHWPARHSPDWEALARSLRARGAAL